MILTRFPVPRTARVAPVMSTSTREFKLQTMETATWSQHSGEVRVCWNHPPPFIAIWSQSIRFIKIHAMMCALLQSQSLTDLYHMNVNECTGWCIPVVSSFRPLHAHLGAIHIGSYDPNDHHGEMYDSRMELIVMNARANHHWCRIDWIIDMSVQCFF